LADRHSDTVTLSPSLAGGQVNKWPDGRAPPRIAYHQVRIPAHGEECGEPFAPVHCARTPPPRGRGDRPWPGCTPRGPDTWTSRPASSWASAGWPPAWPSAPSARPTSGACRWGACVTSDGERPQCGVALCLGIALRRQQGLYPLVQAPPSASTDGDA